MEILNILRDPSWQFIGAIAAVFALGATFLVFIFQKSKKLLGFEIISITPLLTTKESFQGKLIINYDNRIVSNVIILILKIYNVGNVPITSKDYEEPLSIYLGQFTNILSAEIEDKIPENIKISMNLDKNRITFSPTLLNSKDNFTLRILLSEFEGLVKVDARIVGVSSIKSIRLAHFRSLKYMAAGLILMVSSMIYPAIYKITYQNTIEPGSTAYILLFFYFLGAVIAHIGFFKSRLFHMIYGKVIYRLLAYFSNR